LWANEKISSSTCVFIILCGTSFGIIYTDGEYEMEINDDFAIEEKKKAVRFLRTLMIGCAIGAAIWALLLFFKG